MSKERKILAIFPGRHRIGYSIFRDGHLLYYGIQSLSRFRSKKSVSKAINKLLKKTIQRYRINQIAIRKLSKPQKTSLLLPRLVKYVVATCKGKGLSVQFIDGDRVNRKFCEPNERPSTKRTELALVARYPELKRHQSPKQNWQSKYYLALFQSIALGLVCGSDKDEALLLNKYGNQQ